jgi:ankyrin repeat protein
VDPVEHRIFITRPKGLVYDFNTEESTPKDWTEFSFVDFDSKNGLVLSAGPTEGHVAVTLIDPNTDSRTKLAQGSWAFWGPRKDIYFFRGTAQLWRCRQESKTIQPVFRASTEIRSDIESSGSIALSADKSLLAFYYAFSGFRGRQIRGLALFDLTKEEYRQLKDTGRQAMVWVEPSSTASEKSATDFDFAECAPFMVLQDAVFFWGIEPIKALIEQSDVNAPDKMGNTALHYTSEIARADVVEAIIGQGGNVNLKNSNGSTPLHEASEGPIYVYKEPHLYTMDRERTVGNLIGAGASVSVLDDFGETPLDKALRRQFWGIAMQLIEAGGNVGPKSQYKRMTLHEAIATGHRELVELTLANGADINKRDAENSTSLECGWYMARGMMTFLIDRGADVNAKFSDGITALQAAVYQNDLGLVNLLLVSGADPNVVSQYGTPLIQSCVKPGGKAMLRELLAHGADVNARDKQGRTCLHIAVELGSEDLVRLLLDKGADVNLATDRGLTPLALANMSSGENAVSIATLLREHGARK